MANVASQITVRLDDATETQLREIKQHYAKGLRLATVQTSDLVRDLIYNEHKRLFPPTKTRKAVA